MASSLVDFVSWARGIAFYGSVAILTACYVLSEAAKHVLFELCGLDVAVGASKAWTQADQFLVPFSGQDYKHRGKPLPLAIFTFE